MYAKEDVEKKVMSWEMFIEAFKEAGKVCDFFPTYSKIMAQVNSKKETNRYKTAPDSHQITKGEIVPKEKMQEYMKKYRDGLKKKKDGEDYVI